MDVVVFFYIALSSSYDGELCLGRASAASFFSCLGHIVGRCTR